MGTIDIIDSEFWISLLIFEIFDIMIFCIPYPYKRVGALQIINKWNNIMCSETWCAAGLNVRVCKEKRNDLAYSFHIIQKIKDWCAGGRQIY